MCARKAILLCVLCALGALVVLVVAAERGCARPTALADAESHQLALNLRVLAEKVAAYRARHGGRIPDINQLLTEGSDIPALLGLDEEEVPRCFEIVVLPRCLHNGEKTESAYAILITRRPKYVESWSTVCVNGMLYKLARDASASEW